MENLRLISLDVADSTTIIAKFSKELNLSISTSNVSIASQLNGSPDSTILSVDIFADTLTITCQPLTPQTPYFIKFFSTPNTKFTSLNNDAILYEDGATNQQLILGPTDSNNVVQTFLINYLRDNIYNVEDSSTLINNIIQAYSNVMSKTLYDIRQLKNENYLSFVVNDEQKIRGSGPFDRLNEEGAYEILRVGRTSTNTSANLTFKFDSFDDSLITLLAVSANEDLVPGFTDTIGTFNLTDFVLTASNQNVSKLTSVIFLYSDGRNPFTYDISSLGYQIFDSKYDKDFGFSYAILKNNQFKLSTAVLEDSNFSTQNILKVNLVYEYKNLGRIINEDSVQVFTTLSVSREVLPPIINTFNLKHAPIVDSTGTIPILGGVQFVDPNALNSSIPHPAFVNEIPFRLNALPMSIGQYSVDYATGTVYVYGADNTNSGTGPTPPVANYNYLFTYKSEIDYVLDTDTNDLVALPNGSLLNNPANISFEYEEVLVPGVDYNANLHKENLTERIGNNLVALNCLATQNSPITNVFRIFNETSGEVYKLVRWFNNKVYFNYVNPPNIVNSIHERVSFIDQLNETLFVNSNLTNSGHIKIFKCLLSNSNIIAGSEDEIGSFINSSVQFSDTSVFTTEMWYDESLSIQQNIDRLTIGKYLIDYANGIIYCAVSNSQDINIGTISYKKPSIIPQNPHVISVDDIYYQINISNPKDKNFEYIDFGDGFINPTGFDVSDESFLNNDTTAPYQVLNGNIGAFVDGTFVNTVSNNINFIRHIYERNDLLNNPLPIDFSSSATFSGKTISVHPVSFNEYHTISFNGSNFVVQLNTPLKYLSNNLTLNISVIRVSDSKQLWNGSGSLILGNNLTLVLPGINSPHAGDFVNVVYSYSINALSRVIVDYNKGEFYIDYSYLADEIIISYEFGENNLDFRQSLTVSEGTQYFVSYRVGALRDALLKNFGTLINIPELSTFDVDFERERYRDALSAALESFIQGPTVPAIKNICDKITHIEPEIIESNFQNWSLGSSLLNPQKIETNGSFELLPAKYGEGILINQNNQTVSFPASSNLRIEQGTFESWISPEWNGIDNDASLTFSILKDGYTIPSNQIFIGAGEFHPTYSGTSFTISKENEIFGLPNRNKDGVFIYYSPDVSGSFNRWYLEVVDGYDDGYASIYNINVSTTNGSFYDAKSMQIPKPSNIKLISGLQNINFSTLGTAPLDLGITFIADPDHYLFDFGKEKNKNRISLYKDASGYFNFKVFDKKGSMSQVSADVSSWQANQLHHVAASWTLNTKNNRDEIHLFIDGFEVPNIIRYGTKLAPYLHEKYRTINPEEIAGLISKNIAGSNDLTTTAGANTVSSSLNFSALGIVNGDTLYIEENGFNSLGYTISNVNGNVLTLTSIMPLSITNGIFSVNKESFTLTTEINIYPNTTVSTISSILTGTDMATFINTSTVSSSVNFTFNGILPGYLLRIENSQFAKHYTILSVSGNSLVINGNVPATLTGLTYHIYKNSPVEIPGVRALNPSYSITSDSNFNSILTLTNDVKANDLVLINTLGVNHRRVIRKIYQWGNANNIIETLSAPPISLDQVSIYHILLANTIINSSNSTAGAGSFTSNNITAIDQPSVSDHGRTLSVHITTTNNIDFTTPLTVHVNGVVNGSTITETLSFSNVGSQNTVNKFTSVNFINVSGKYLNINKTFVAVSLQEAYSITIPENSLNYPVIRYSYQLFAGNTLSGSGTNISDSNGFFSSLDVGNYIVISSPGSVVGTYKILSVSADHKSATIDKSLVSFSNGVYQVLNATAFRSGFQNGFFVLEEDGYAGQPYNLQQGLYELDYYTYLTVKMDPVQGDVFIGSDIFGNNQINAIVDETKIDNIMLSDTRIGETSLVNQDSITKNFNSLKALKKNENTLFLCHYDSFPLVNDSDFYLAYESKNFIQSGVAVNDNFNKSLYIADKPFIVDNNGILNTTREGTIEFWVNPQFDTMNDPNYRFYFDASPNVIENVVSLDEVSVKVSGRVSQILSVKLQGGDNNIDYFAGGRVELDTTNAISEENISSTSSSVMTGKQILQVITVKIANDPTQTDYFSGGVIGTDKRTIFLGKQLPSNNLALVVVYKPADNINNNLNGQVIRLNRSLPKTNMPVVVNYVPSGTQGDRMSIFKDTFGYINFNVHASGLDYLVRAPTVWASNTWHRIKATYKFNNGVNEDTIRLFLDGYEYGNILFGTGLVFGATLHVFGSSFSGEGGLTSTIKFKDVVNELYIGSEYTRTNTAFALIDNFRISNIARPVFAPYGESIDVNYNSNLDVVFPVVDDLYTTLLLDFETLLEKTTDFVELQNKNGGGFDFLVNVLDSFGIVEESAKVQQVLETLIKTLKPASSRAFIKYIR